MYELILKTLVLHFEPDSIDFYYYKVDNFIEKDSSIKIGDVVYAQEYMTSRPEYGIALISWNEESAKKILVTDGEGQPELSESIVNKLAAKHVTYNMANSDVFYLFMGDNEGIDMTTWVLPSVCLRITEVSKEIL